MRVPISIVSATLLLIGGASMATAKAAHPDEMTFSLASNAKIVAGPKPESLGQLKIGDPVTVTYVTRGSSHVATRVELARTAAHTPVKKSPD